MKIIATMIFMVSLITYINSVHNDFSLGRNIASFLIGVSAYYAIAKK